MNGDLSVTKPSVSSAAPGTPARSHSVGGSLQRSTAEPLPPAEATVANTNPCNKKWSCTSWLVTAAGTPSCPHHSPQKPQQDLPKMDSKAASTCLMEEPGERRGRQPSAQPRLLLWECGRQAGCCWRSSHWKRQAGTGPPLQGQGSALPARIHPHSPAMSAASPLLGTSRHPAGSGTQPGLPCQHRNPRSAAASRPFTSWCTGSPASIGASRTFLWSTASLRDRGS